MDHVAIDLGARKSQVCVRSANGEIVEEKRLETWDLKQYLTSRPKSRVIVETCADSSSRSEPATSSSLRMIRLRRGEGHVV
jgi:hypothetical protein